MKRLAVATLFGLVAGAICATIIFTGGILKFTPVTLGWILLNRAVMGFVIGASALKLRWAWNGIVMGVVVGLIFSWFLYMTLGPVAMPFLSPIGNAAFGLMIEFFTTVVVKQPAPGSGRRMERAATA